MISKVYQFDPQFSGGIKLFRCNLKLSFILSDVKHIFKTLVLSETVRPYFHELHIFSSSVVIGTQLNTARGQWLRRQQDLTLRSVTYTLSAPPLTVVHRVGTILAQHCQSCPWSMYKTFVLYIMSTCIIF